mmetsp:Transcript_47269/g.86809  ORF Transcript_47269/g.86809 Transcript_47269/m.86809 type:complete len:206 (-) Transcript_47269:371-988(-)
MHPLNLAARSSAALAIDSGVRKFGVVLTSSLAKETEELTAFASSTCFSNFSIPAFTSSVQATKAMLSGPTASRASSLVCVPFARMSACNRGSMPVKKLWTDTASLSSTRTEPPLRSATAPPAAAPACCQSGSCSGLPRPTSTTRTAGPPKGFATSTVPAVPANLVCAMNSSSCPSSFKSNALSSGKSTTASFVSASSGCARVKTT